MVQINFAQKEIQCKIVYYGPGMSGKTTNLEVVHSKVPPSSRGEMTSIATTGERTLYFDYMPLELGQIAGIKTKFQLYTVPGQIYYKSTRRLVLQGVDGIVFVADSSASKLKENQESLADLEENLKDMGKSLSDVPIVIQYNKRDLPDAMPIEQLQERLNLTKIPHFEAVANKGDGVFPTLKELAGRVLEAVNNGGGLAAGRAKAAGAKTPATTPAPAPTETVNAATPPPVAPPKPIPQHAPAAAAPAPAHAPVHSPGHAPAHAPAHAPVTSPRPKPSPKRTAVAASAGSHARGESATATAVAPPRASPSGGAVPAPVAAPAYAARSYHDRVVSVSGLKRGSSRTRMMVIVALTVLIAGAVYFAMKHM